MASREALIKRVPKGGTCSVKGLARQLGYLSRQNDPERQTIPLVNAQRHQFNPGTPDAVDPNNVWAFARRVYARSGRLPPDNPGGELPNDLTIHFVVSFPEGTDFDAAERTGRDWAEYVFGHGYRDDQGFAQRHDYVTAFHSHENDSAHPHMHVIVDRCPLGGGNLLTLQEGHPHWSYEAMRFHAVDAAANHGIELVATTREDRGLADPAMTDAELREFRRQRPITLEEDLRRRTDAVRVPHFDPRYDDIGIAPDDGEEPGGRDERDLRRGCTPVLLSDTDDDDFAPFDPGGDDDDGPPSDDDGQDRRRRARSPAPSPAGRSDDGNDRPDGRHGRADDDEDDEILPDADNDGSPQSSQSGAGKRKRTDAHAGPAPKRARIQPANGEPATNRETAAASGNRQNPLHPPQAGAGGEEMREAQPRDPVQQRREAANRQRRAALEALRAHRRGGRNSAAGTTRAWREEDARLRREAKLALIEQRRAHEGMTNVTTRAQAERLRNAGRADAAQTGENQASARAAPRRGRSARRARSDQARSR